MFPSYVENPKDCHFEGQDQDEKILLLLRAHPVTNLPWIILAILLSLLPFFLPLFIGLAGLQFGDIPRQAIMLAVIINYLFVLIVVFEGFLSWYFNVHIMTDKRIVDFDFHSLLYKNVDLAPLHNIQEANSHVKGLFGSIFHFGDVFIQTAGARVAIDFYNVPQPHKVSDKIMDEVDKIKGKGGNHASGS